MPNSTLHIHLEINRAQLRWALAALLVCAQAGDLASESLTFTTTYPSPAGIYNQVVTTGNAGTAPANTTLNQNAGNSILVPAATNPTGNVGIGIGAPGAKLEVFGGDVYVATAGKGILVKSPDGSQCQRILIDNSGNLATVSATCP